MGTPLNQRASGRTPIAFLFLFVFMIGVPAGAYFFSDLSRFQKVMAAHQSQRALQGATTDPKQIDEAVGRHPSNRILQLTAMATKAAAETSAAAETLSNEVEPPTLSKNIDLGAANRSDLEALRRDLRTAEAKAATIMPRYIALIKAERDKVGAYALSLHLEKDIVRRFLDGVDQQHAKITDLTSRMLSARADYYRAYESYVAVLAGEFGAYKVVDGQFVFSLQRAVDRYHVAAHALTAAAKRVAELEEERKSLMQSQHAGGEQLVDSK
jgi:hypothetical protein